jgi:hypothetical protein
MGALFLLGMEVTPSEGPFAQTLSAVPVIECDPTNGVRQGISHLSTMPSNFNTFG